MAQNKSNHQVQRCLVNRQHRGYAISMQKRKLIEQGFGWAKFIGPIRQADGARHQERVDQVERQWPWPPTTSYAYALGQIRLGSVMRLKVAEMTSNRKAK